MEKASQSQQAFLKYWIPLIDVLKELGGSGKLTEVTDLVIEKLNISEKEQAATLKSGSSRVRNQIAWARMYLVKSGFMDSSQRGVWNLTEKGLKSSLTYEDVFNIFKEVQAGYKNNIEQKKQKNENFIPEKDDSLIESSDYQAELLSLLQSLPPSGFERLCQRLLREAGFEQVTVTGKTNDGGIDGHGIFQENTFVSSRVLFQCKRYKGSVSASQIRDFRGAMIGRADKGIIITTGSFTKEAKQEAHRVLPLIEMVDGDKLINLFEKLELGLKPKKDYGLDYDFFENFKE